MARSRPQRRSGNRVLRGIGWTLLVGALLIGIPLALLAGFTSLQTKHHMLIALATFIPFGWVPAVIGALGLALVARRWWKTISIVVLAVAFIIWGWPNVPITRPVTPVPAQLGIELLSANVQYGRADIDDLLANVDENTDLLVFQEYTSAFDQQLAQAGVNDDFPHRIGTIREDAGGTMILSRHPLTEVDRTDDTAFDNILVRVNVRERDWLIAAVHTAPPQLGAASWAHDGASVLAMLEPHLDERLVAVGDFNAIDEHHTMRQFAAAGFRNAMGSATATKRPYSWEPTWPVGGTVPPFARIDHALASPDTSIWRPWHFEIAGTDHKAMIVSGALPPAP